MAARLGPVRVWICSDLVLERGHHFFVDEEWYSVSSQQAHRAWTLDGYIIMIQQQFFKKEIFIMCLIFSCHWHLLDLPHPTLGPQFQSCLLLQTASQRFVPAGSGHIECDLYTQCLASYVKPEKKAMMLRGEKHFSGMLFFSGSIRLPTSAHCRGKEVGHAQHGSAVLPRICSSRICLWRKVTHVLGEEEWTQGLWKEVWDVYLQLGWNSKLLTWEVSLFL